MEIHFSAHAAVECVCQRLLYLMALYRHGCDVVDTLCIICELECSDETIHGYEFFCVEEMRLHLQHNFFDQLCGIAWNRFIVFWRLVCQSISLAIHRLCVIFLYSLQYMEVCVNSVHFRTFYVLVKTESTLDDTGEKWRWSELLEDNDDFLRLRRLLHSSWYGLSVFLVLLVAGLRISESIDESNTEREVDVEGTRDMCSFPMLSPKYVSFSIVVLINTGNRADKWDYVRVRVVNASIHVGNLVSVLRFGLNRSS